MPGKLLIIGGDAAGMSAATQARRVDPNLEVRVLEKGAYVSYSKCAQPYYVGNVVPYFEDLIVYTPEYFREERGIDVRVQHEAIAIDRGAHTVEVLNHLTGERSQETYDRLVIATGARPTMPPLPGIDAPNIFALRGLQDTLAIKEAAGRDDVSRAVILGSGYIGLEMAEAFVLNGLDVTVVEMAETILCGVSPECALEPELGECLAETLITHGVTLFTGEAVLSFDADASGGVTLVQTERRALPTDLVLVAAGVRPHSALAAAAGIALGVGDAIRVDERMATSDPDIFAAGDCAEHFHRVLGRPDYVPLGTTANRQGHVAGENAAGGDARFAGILGTAATKIFELEAARTGLGMGAARNAGFDPVAVFTESVSRSPYYPGSTPIRLKVIADRATRRLLGAQAAGEEGVATRIDVFATALHAGITVDELAEMDLAYAPPLAPLWDPVVLAARQAGKALAGR